VRIRINPTLAVFFPLMMIKIIQCLTSEKRLIPNAVCDVCADDVAVAAGLSAILEFI
jgi:hypothetical protein